MFQRTQNLADCLYNLIFLIGSPTRLILGQNINTRILNILPLEPIVVGDIQLQEFELVRP